MKHAAQHELPISNGWHSNAADRIEVWCGRCKNSFTPTAEWVNRYYDAARRRIEQRGGFNPVEWRGFTEDENLRALEGIERDRAAALGVLVRASIDATEASA